MGDDATSAMDPAPERTPTGGSNRRGGRWTAVLVTAVLLIGLAAGVAARDRTQRRLGYRVEAGRSTRNAVELNVEYRLQHNIDNDDGVADHNPADG